MEVSNQNPVLKNMEDPIVQDAYFSKIYKKYFPQTEAYILKNNGTKDDARDIFQEVIIVLLNNTKNPDFKLTSSLGTYLFAITRNLWHNKLRGEHKKTTIPLFDEIQDDFHDENKLLLETKLQGWIIQITKHCQKLITSLFYIKEPMINLAARMGWKNRHTADNQKYKCIQQLKKIKDKERSLQ